MIKRCGKCYQTLTYEQAWFDEVHICGESVPQKSYIEQKELLMEEGKKYDGGKPRMDLLPPNAIMEVAKVLAFGAEKYAPENWRKLEDLQNRYTGASLRHVFAHMDKERLDKETHLSHLAHAICCLLFKLEIELEETSEEERLRGLERNECSKSNQTTQSSYVSGKGWFREQADNKKGSVPAFKDCIQYPTSSQNNRGVQ
jgi:hypothetical protein